MRVQLAQCRMTLDQADLVETWLQGLDAVDQAAVHERTCCAIIYLYRGQPRRRARQALRGFSYQSEEAAKLVRCPTPAVPPTGSIRKNWWAWSAARQCGICSSRRRCAWRWTLCRSLPYLGRAVRCLWRRQLHVELLDGLSIGISVGRRDFGTAGIGDVPAGDWASCWRSGPGRSRWPTWRDSMSLNM